MSRFSVFFAAVRCEGRILSRDAALWLVLAMIVATVAYALHNGTGLLERRLGAVQAAQQDEQKRVAGLREALADIESGKAKPPDAPFRDPRNAVFVGSGSAATNAVLPPLPLAVVAVGQSDLYPPTLRVSSRSKDTFFFSDEIANPSHLLTGAFDLAFVLVFIFPLCILALTYNLVSGEREQGTLALTAACPTSLRGVMLAKLLVRAGTPIGFTLAVVLIGLALSADGLAAAGAPTALLAVAIVVYGAFWAALAAAVNSLGRDSAYNALLLIGAWITILLIVPTLVNAWAEARHPAPSRAEMVLAVRAASVHADRERDAALARYQEEHGHTHDDELKRGSYRERTLRRLAVQQASIEAAESVMAKHEAQLRRQHTLAARYAYLSPALLMHDALSDIAGTGRARYGEYLAQVDGFHHRWRDFFMAKAGADPVLTAEDYRQFPRFQFQEPSGAGLWSHVAPALAGMGAALALLAVLAARGLRRYRVV